MQTADAQDTPALPLPTVEGLGLTPEGFGQLPAGVHVVTGPASHCKNWLLAFVDGSPRPNVVVAGHAFSSYQKAIKYFEKKTSGPVYFTFTNNKGTYLFCYEVMKGRKVIKVCHDGMQAIQTPNGKANVTLQPLPPRQSALGQVEGLGQVPVWAPPAGLYQGLPSNPGLTWWNYGWIYIPGAGLPSDPGAAGIVPPNQPVYNNGQVGSWVAGYAGEWYWFPNGLYTQIVGARGEIYDVYAQDGWASSDIAAGLTSSSYTPPPRFTPSPNDPTAPLGQWINTMCPDYWVWMTNPVSDVASALGTSSSTATWILIGVGVLVVGGITFAVWELA